MIIYIINIVLLMNNHILHNDIFYHKFIQSFIPSFSYYTDMPTKYNIRYDITA